MSEAVIKDGTGKGFSASVNSNNRLRTHAETLELLPAVSLRDGKAFMYKTDFVALTTTGSFSGLVYIQNSSTTPLAVMAIRTCGTAYCQWRILKNPTGGTLISGGTASTPLAMNFTSAEDFEGTALVGADTNTVTGATVLGTWINGGPGHSVEEFSGALILGQGDSVALEVQPSAAATVCSTIQLAYVNATELGA